METILDFATVFLLKTFTQYLHVISAMPEDPLSGWHLKVRQTTDTGILHINIPHSTEELWFFENYCPEEWNNWKCLESYKWQTPREILTNASATTAPQIIRMKNHKVDLPMPAFLDLSDEGINMVISTFLKPNQKILDEIKGKLVQELDEIL